MKKLRDDALISVAIISPLLFDIAVTVAVLFFIARQLAPFVITTFAQLPSTLTPANVLYIAALSVGVSIALAVLIAIARVVGGLASRAYCQVALLFIKRSFTKYDPTVLTEPIYFIHAMKLPRDKSLLWVHRVNDPNIPEYPAYDVTAEAARTFRGYATRERIIEHVTDARIDLVYSDGHRSPPGFLKPYALRTTDAE